ncbi:MAG: hypothetical protein AABX85_02055 [Nanoarchaeota archaeon]
MHKKKLTEICKGMYFGQKVDIEYQESPKSVLEACLVFRKYEETDDGRCVVWLSKNTVRENYNSSIKIPNEHLPQIDNTEIITFFPRKYFVDTSFTRNGRLNGVRMNMVEVNSERSPELERETAERETSHKRLVPA